MPSLPLAIDPLTPTEEEAMIARDLKRDFKNLSDSAALSITLTDGEVEKTVRLTHEDQPLLIEVLAAIAKGRPVAVLPVDEELSTQQAADLLNVSRPYLIGLLERNEIPFRTVGTWRRVRLADVLAYKRRSDSRRRAAQQELVDQAQELDLGY